MKKKLLSIFVAMAFVMGLMSFHRYENTVYAENNEMPMQNDHYTVIDDNGNVIVEKYDEKDNQIQNIESNDYEVIKSVRGQEEVVKTFDTYNEAQDAMKDYQRLRSEGTYSIEAINTKASANSVAYLKGYITYKEVENNKQGRSGYTHGTSANDAAYISTSHDGKTIRVKQAGVVMDVPASQVSLETYNRNSKVSYYYGKNGKFYHYYYHGSRELASTQVGYTPDYLKDGVKYYSYDGHYFYTSYTTLLSDYQSGSDYYQHAVNKDKPFYNYYQYLSMRSTTHFSADQFNKFVLNQKGPDSNSKLLNQGQALINAQNQKGINASLMLGVAINESAWGTSRYALERNNLFGLGAVDSNPDAAYRFDTVQDCFVYFAYNALSAGYLDGMDWRYRGPHLGDKRSGINVKYASDPYWGEKAASFSYSLNAANQNNDYQKYQIGISKSTAQKLYKDSSFSKKLYDSSVNDTHEELYCYPVTVLNKEGSSYKILSDTVLNSSRTGKDANGTFNINKDYVYVPQADINLVGEVFANTYYPGDVNGDGKVSSLDYIQVKNHIMKVKTLSGDSLARADVNDDGKVTSLDYIKIKNHIMGTNKLF